MDVNEIGRERRAILWLNRPQIAKHTKHAAERGTVWCFGCCQVTKARDRLFEQRGIGRFPCGKRGEPTRRDGEDSAIRVFNDSEALRTT